MSFHTSRDVLAIDPVNPARIPTRVICQRLGIGPNQARALRELATRSPQVLRAQAVISVQRRAAR